MSKKRNIREEFAIGIGGEEAEEKEMEEITV